MPASVNERLLDAQIGHNVDLQHYANGVVRRIIATLNKADPDIAAKLQAALESMPPESFTVQRLEDLLISVRALNTRAYQQIGEELRAELKDLANHEAGYQLDLFRSVLPKEVSLASVNAFEAYSAALSRPFQGVLLREALDGLEAGRAKAIRDAIRIGYISQETIPQIVQRIRGTKARGYADGLLEAPRRHIESLVRTGVSHTAGVTRDTFFAANTDVIAAVTWVSTLDSRTSPMCRIRDGLQYTSDHKPVGHKVPWGQGPGRLHWCCRSTSSPVTRSWQDLGINMQEFSPSERASMDGTVPADTTYAEWIKRQSAPRQDQILGATRGALLRRGGMSLGDFYNDKGRELSLSDLKARDAEAFTKAGV